MTLIDHIKLWILEHPDQWDAIFPLVAAIVVIMPIAYWWSKKQEKK